ncbi:MAG: hypothetical protein K6T85_15975 [Gorillibacterium sp.]|nr:hypothetical protein [Gorillibacterium sp.]
MGFYGNNNPMVSPYENGPALSPYGNMPFSPVSVSAYPCTPPVVKAEAGLSFVLVLFILLVIILRSYC